MVDRLVVQDLDMDVKYKVIYHNGEDEMLQLTGNILTADGSDQTGWILTFDCGRKKIPVIADTIAQVWKVHQSRPKATPSPYAEERVY